MDNDFLKRIILERDYKTSLLRENLELGNIDKDILFQSLNEIATLQYRYFGHFDIINIPAGSTIEEKLKSMKQSFFVLEKSVAFVDGIVAALSSGSINRHLLSPYHAKNNEMSIRNRIIVSGHNEILESYGFQPSDL
ncbi:hypothetical protein [Altericista sp. CCNU0014]|uniref:hypothetical protein n=1 Tax=Altericista sp. CCNU0014 TaxID=3082949 RepID=UPI00384CCC5A